MQANHENVVRLHGLMQFQTSIGLVMDYLPGGDLLSLLDEIDIDLSWSYKLRVCTEISSGLAYLHGMVVKERKVVHGDVKPENILLDNDFHALLSDFGSSSLASITSRAGNTTSYYTAGNTTSEQAKHYTPAYCAPEVLCNPFYKAKSSSDMFSYAMTVYHVIFRNCPMQQQLLHKVIKQSLEDGARPPLDIDEKNASEKDKSIIKKLYAVVKNCWKTKEAERSTSVEVRETLTVALDSISNREEIHNTVVTIGKSVLKKSKTDDVQSWIPLAEAIGDKVTKKQQSGTQNLSEAQSKCTNQILP